LPNELDLREAGITGLPESSWDRCFAVGDKTDSHNEIRIK